MKKSLLLAVFCFAISSLSFGQLKIIDTAGNVVTNDTIVTYGIVGNEMTTSLNVVNTSIDSLNIYAKRDSISTPSPFDSNNTFCWVFCYSFGDTNNLSLGGELLNKWNTPGDTSYSSFLGYYKPLGRSGPAFIKYTFFSARNPSIASWVVIKYDALPAGINSISANSIHFSTPYPSPASNFVNFSYNLANGVQSANMKIFNIVGECVQTLPLSASKNKSTIDVESMPSGIYVCEIQANGCQPVYQKMVVSH